MVVLKDSSIDKLKNSRSILLVTFLIGLLVWVIIWQTTANKASLMTNIPVVTRTHPQTSNDRRDICLLLTMYAEPSRLPRYHKIVDQWLRNTNLDIFVIDSSGNFRHSSPRVTVESFIQDNGLSADVSVRESNSLRHLYERHHQTLNQYGLICKVTSKYYVPELADTLSMIPLNAKVVLQSRQDCYGQNSEIFVVSPTLLPVLANEMKDSMETTVLELGRKHSLTGTTFRLPTFNIPENTWVRNDGSLMLWL